jgi:hypothetical protein
MGRKPRNADPLAAVPRAQAHSRTRR